MTEWFDTFLRDQPAPDWIKDGVQALEGVVETDWLASTFTMNWKMTRICEWVRFEKGEPFCMLVPVPRGLIEKLVPKRVPIAANPELQKQYQAWENSRKGFLIGLKERDPDAMQRGWQKDYFQGKTPDGQEFHEHQTRLEVREFSPMESTPVTASGKDSMQNDAAAASENTPRD